MALLAQTTGDPGGAASGPGLGTRGRRKGRGLGERGQDTAGGAPTDDDFATSGGFEPSSSSLSLSLTGSTGAAAAAPCPPTIKGRPPRATKGRGKGSDKGVAAFGAVAVVGEYSGSGG